MGSCSADIVRRQESVVMPQTACLPISKKSTKHFMHQKKAIMALCITALPYMCMHAQTTMMSVDDMFRLADENSKSIQAFKSGKEAADEAVKAAKAQRLPDINVSLSASYLGDGTIWDRDFSNIMKIDMPHFGNNFALEAQQVIYSGGAISSGIEMAELGKRMAELDWLKNRQEIRFMLVGHYLELYKLSNQIKVLEKNLEMTEQVISNMKVRREQGTALKNDITRYELQKENLKLQLAKVEDAYKIINHQLVTTLHMGSNTIIKPDTTAIESQISTLSEAEWQGFASTNNIDLQQAKAGVSLSEQKLRAERSELLPKIAVVAADHLDGPITIEVPTLDNNFNYWYVGVGVKYSLSSLFKNNRKVRQAKISARQAKEQEELAQEQVENAVQASFTNFMTSYTELRTQEKSVELADENYSVTNNRYINELALLTDMLDASNMKLSADLGLVNARINVLFNYYKMKYVTHTL